MGLEKKCKNYKNYKNYFHISELQRYFPNELVFLIENYSREYPWLEEFKNYYSKRKVIYSSISYFVLLCRNDLGDCLLASYLNNNFDRRRIRYIHCKDSYSNYECVSSR